MVMLIRTKGKTKEMASVPKAKPGDVHAEIRFDFYYGMPYASFNVKSNLWTVGPYEFPWFSFCEPIIYRFSGLDIRAHLLKESF